MGWTFGRVHRKCAQPKSVLLPTIDTLHTNRFGTKTLTLHTCRGGAKILMVLADDRLSKLEHDPDRTLMRPSKMDGSLNVTASYFFGTLAINCVVFKRQLEIYVRISKKQWAPVGFVQVKHRRTLRD